MQTISFLLFFLPETDESSNANGESYDKRDCHSQIFIRRIPFQRSGDRKDTLCIYNYPVGDKQDPFFVFCFSSSAYADGIPDLDRSPPVDPQFYGRDSSASLYLMSGIYISVSISLDTFIKVCDVVCRTAGPHHSSWSYHRL